MQEGKKQTSPIKTIIASVLIIGLIASLGYLVLTSDDDEGERNGGEKGETNGIDETESRVDSIDTMEETVVIFEDQILENHVREELSKPEGDILSTDMLNLYYLSISELGVTDLTGLEYALELTEFTLARENINSLEPLKNLSNLERFSLRYSEIEDLPIEFSEEVNLKHVSIVNTEIKDTTFLTHMTNVDHLTMTDAGLTDISSLKDLNNVQQLNLRGNEIEDISSLKGKNNLEILNLQHNNVSDVSPLADLEKLYDLVLSYNPAYNLTPLNSLPSLETLIIYLDHEVKDVIFDQVEVFKNQGVDVQYHR